MSAYGRQSPRVGHLAAAPPRRGRRGGTILTPLLLVVGSVLTALALLAGWAQWQLLSTDAWGSTSTKLIERKEIRDRVAEYVVNEARGASGSTLGSAQDRRLVRAVSQQLQTDRAERVWRVTTTEAHRQAVRLIEDDNASSGDVVTLDLRPLIRAVERQIGIPLPTGASSSGQVTIVAGDQVRGARDAAKRLKRTATVLLIAAPLVLLMAVALASGWRLRALAGVGVAVAAAGVMVLLTRALVGSHVVDVLANSAADHDAVAAVWDVGTSQLATMAWIAILAGLGVAVGASVAARRPGARYA